jgi:hypothetical protein
MLLTSDNDARRWHRRQGRLDLPIDLFYRLAQPLGVRDTTISGICMEECANSYRITVPKTEATLGTALFS